GLKVFLTALAVTDDIGGILVIAIFYSSHIAYQYLLLSLVVMGALWFGARKGINHPGFYAAMGIVMWFFFFHSGIHPTIAGVLVAFFVPARPKIDSYQFLAKLKSSINRFPPVTQMNKGVVVLSHDQTHILHRLHTVSNRVISPLQKVENMLHPVVTFFIIPVFAFVNAGVVLDGITPSTVTGAATMGVFCGLFFGKFIGIFTFSYIALKAKIVSIPSQVTMRQIAAVAVIGGIGFTVSLFIADLSYAGIPEVGASLLNEAKMGIIGASLLAGLIGYFFLRFELRKAEKADELRPDQIEGNN
ncbi:MAG: Na+/H+ antiporter NhaA, partial [Rikenellaceae bacterium]